MHATHRPRPGTAARQRHPGVPARAATPRPGAGVPPRTDPGPATRRLSPGPAGQLPRPFRHQPRPAQPATFAGHAGGLVLRRPGLRRQRVPAVLSLLGPVPYRRPGGDPGRQRLRRVLRHTLGPGQGRLWLLQQAGGDGRVRLLRPRPDHARADIQRHPQRPGPGALGALRPAPGLPVQRPPAAGGGDPLRDGFHRRARRHLGRRLLAGRRRATGELLPRRRSDLRRAAVLRAAQLQASP